MNGVFSFTLWNKLFFPLVAIKKNSYTCKCHTLPLLYLAGCTFLVVLSVFAAQHSSELAHVINIWLDLDLCFIICSMFLDFFLLCCCSVSLFVCFHMLLYFVNAF